MYVQRVTIYPSPQNVREVRELLVERVKARQAAGSKAALAELVAGSDAPQFTVNARFDDLAAFEASRKRDQADADFQKFVAKLTSLLRKPSAFDLMELLVSMPN